VDPFTFGGEDNSGACPPLTAAFADGFAAAVTGAFASTASTRASAALIRHPRPPSQKIPPNIRKL
jgi:hypothetical protein